jgi:hypothetical protein
MRQSAFEDQRVGRGDNEFFKVTGIKNRPQRIAYIPATADESQLAFSPELQRRATAKDAAAIETMEDIRALRENLAAGLKRKPPSAEIWADETGKKLFLYAKTQAAKVFWIDGVGYVRWREDVPDGCAEKPAFVLYGFILLEYELDSENEPVTLRPEEQIEVGDGHRLAFKYELKVWTLNDAKTRALKEHSRTNPVISTDYLVWTQKEGLYDRTKFSPAGPALWRQDPLVMRRIIKEAAKLYANLPQLIAKDFTTAEIIQMTAAGSQQGRGHSTTPEILPEETDFASLLGRGSKAEPDFPELSAAPVIEVEPEAPKALENALTPETPLETASS